jgi:MYXO-CTERM domain-containing protein
VEAASSDGTSSSGGCAVDGGAGHGGGLAAFGLLGLALAITRRRRAT